jgi:hypothetical protein
MNDKQEMIGGEEAGAIEVRGYREGTMVYRQLCESAEEAAAVVDAWEQLDGVECEVDDLSRERQLDDEAPADLTETLIDDGDEY